MLPCRRYDTGSDPTLIVSTVTCKVLFSMFFRSVTLMCCRLSLLYFFARGAGKINTLRAWRSRVDVESIFCANATAWSIPIHLWADIQLFITLLVRLSCFHFKRFHFRKLKSQKNSWVNMGSEDVLWRRFELRKRSKWKLAIIFNEMYSWRRSRGWKIESRRKVYSQ